MKKALLSIISVLMLSSCGSIPEKTFANLQDAMNNEQQLYDYFVLLAPEITGNQDSLYQVTSLFEAAAAAKKIRVENCIKVLKEIKGDFVTEFQEPEPDYPFEDYLSNSQERLKYNIEQTSAMLTASEEEGCESATKYFSNARAIDGKLANYISMLENAISTGGKSAMSFVEWKVCPVCGDIYMSDDLMDKCDICETDAAKFQTFTTKSNGAE